MRPIDLEREPLTREQLVFFNKLYRDYTAFVFSLAFRLTNNHEVAKDIRQDVFLTALFKLDLLMSHPSIEGWLYEVVIHQKQHYWRGVKTKNEVSLESIPEYAAPIRMEDGDLEDLLKGILSNDERDMAVWFYKDGLTLEEIALRRGITYNTCKVYMSLLRSKLKKYLEKN